jgi:RimJ/RimL family protein N-acetyltransferase
MRGGEGERLRELRLAALRDAPGAFTATAEGDAARPMRHWNELAHGPGTVLIAGDFSGMAGIFVEAGRPQVWGMWVAPEHRRSGAGRALVDAAAHWARVRGFETLTLDVCEREPAARAFYEALGFTPTGEVHGDGLIGLGLPLRPQPRAMRTGRLLIREFEASDLDALHELRTREESVRWLYEDPPSLLEDRARLDRRMRNLRFALTGDALGFAAVADGELVADISLFLRSAEHHQGEIGFIAHPDHWGRGYATEAAAAVLELGFETFALHRIIGRLEARNAASARVLEKLGMCREAHLVENELVKGEWQSEIVYAKLRASRGA